MSSNPMQFIFDLFDKFQGFVNACKTFLYTEISVAGYDFSVWQFLGGGILVAILIVIVVKTLTPLL